MKFKLKMIAIAAALASLAGGAQADLITTNTNNGTLVLTAFNTVTKGWYMRDLGFTLNSFLPTGVLASVGDPLSAVVGDRTPTGGLSLNAGNTTSFGDASGWAAWTSTVGFNLNDVLWNVNAVDSRSASGQLVARAITTSANTAETASNGEVRNFASGNGAGTAAAFFGAGTLSKFDAGINQPYNSAIEGNWGLGGDGNAILGQSVDLYYFAATTQTLSPGVNATTVKYGNAAGSAAVSLAANGQLSYTLAPEGQVAAVPLPAAVWLMGAGLLALGGAARRRKAAGQV